MMKEDFKWIGRELFVSGLIDSHGGNMSVRDGDRIIITRRDAMLGRLEDGDLIEVGMEENAAADGEASRELVVHRAIYANTKAKAVVHAHPPNATAISISDNKIVPQDATGQYLLKSVSIVRANNPIASNDVARILPQFLSDGSGIAAVKSHGTFAAGETLEEAYRYTSALELSSKILVALRSTATSKPPQQKQHQHRKAIPPSIGVMDRRDRRRYRR